MDIVDPRIEEYLERLSSPHEQLLAELSDETAEKLGSTSMLTGPVAGLFLELLVLFCRPRRGFVFDMMKHIMFKILEACKFIVFEMCG